MEENRRLSPKQQKAILALLEQPTIREAAQTCRIGETTLYGWLNEPAFSAEYHIARQRMFEATLAALQSASGEAVKTLLTITKDAQAAPGSRVAAARSILEFSLKAKTEIEIEERLRALEQLGGLHDKPNSWTN